MFQIMLSLLCVLTFAAQNYAQTVNPRYPSFVNQIIDATNRNVSQVTIAQNLLRICSDYSASIKSYGEPCTAGNDECANGLYCVSSFCRCPSNEFWNKTYCETKLVLYFELNYKTKTVNQYNGITFNKSDDIKVIEQPTYYIYVSVEDPGVVAQYDQSGSYIKHVSVPNVWGIQTVNNTSIYATRYDSQTMYKLDSNLNVIYQSIPADSSTYIKNPLSIRYNPSNGYLYECDGNGGFVNVFDLNYKRIESFKLNNNELPYGINFYQNANLGNLLLVTTGSNSIQILKQSDKTIYKTLNPICSSGSPPDIIIDQKSGYFIVSCVNDDRVQLWYTNGTDFTNTGKSISIVRPNGMCFDSNGRLMIANYKPASFSILTLF